MHKMDFDIKNFYVSKDTIKEVKGSPQDGMNIFANQMWKGSSIQNTYFKNLATQYKKINNLI